MQFLYLHVNMVAGSSDQPRVREGAPLHRVHVVLENVRLGADKDAAAIRRVGEAANVLVLPSRRYPHALLRVEGPRVDHVEVGNVLKMGEV